MSPLTAPPPEILTVVYDDDEHPRRIRLAPYADFDGQALKGLKADNAPLAHARFHSAKMKGALLPRALFRDATLAHADISSSQMQEAVFDGANLFKANLSGSVLTKCSFKSALVSSVHLDDADLTGANLAEAKLFGSSFKKALLAKAILVDARCEEADFSGADLTGAKLRGARFWKASPGQGADRMRLAWDDIPAIAEVQRKIQALFAEPVQTAETSFPAYVLDALLPGCQDAAAPYGAETLLALILVKSRPDLEQIPPFGAACDCKNAWEWPALLPEDWGRTNRPKEPLPTATLVSAQKSARLSRLVKDLFGSTRDAAAAPKRTATARPKLKAAGNTSPAPK